MSFAQGLDAAMIGMRLPASPHHGPALMTRLFLPILAFLLLATGPVLAQDAGVTATPGDAPVPATPDPADVLITAPPIPVFAPELGVIGFDVPDAHCRLMFKVPPVSETVDTSEAEEGELPQAAPAKAGDKAEAPAAAAVPVPPLLFFTERRYDSMVMIERGYARIDALLRELELVSREKTPETDTRIYRTLGTDQVTLTLALRIAGMTKTETRIEGSAKAERAGAASEAELEGLCLPDAANERAKP